MKISDWINLTDAERANSVAGAKGNRLSDTDLYSLSWEVCRLLRERLAGVPGCLEVEMGQNPESGEHTMLVYIDELNADPGETVPDAFLGFPVRQMEIGIQRRSYREIWKLVLGNLLSWPDSKISEWIALSEVPSKRLFLL